MPMKVYDSAEIRRSAAQVKSSLNSVQTGAQPPLKAMRQALDERMEGEAARALAERLSRLDTDLRRFSECLSALSGQLYRFADSVDEADAKMKALF